MVSPSIPLTLSSFSTAYLYKIASHFRLDSPMPFPTEPPGYDKTIMSDLQGAWSNLRSAVVEHHPFPGSHRLLLHIDEAVSWENVRNLDGMKAALLLIMNITAQADMPGDVQFWVSASHLTTNYYSDWISKVTVSENVCRNNHSTGGAEQTTLPWKMA